MPPIPTITEHLRSEYSRWLETHPQDSLSLEGFVDFCEEYLEANPVVNVWYPGQSVGLQLANHTQIVFSRGAQEQAARDHGNMQPSGAIAITDGNNP